MKILYLTTRLPYPIIGGDKLRVFHLLKELKTQGNDITLVCLNNDENDLREALDNPVFYTKLIPVDFYAKFSYIKASLSTFDNLPFTVRYFYSQAMQQVIDKELQNNEYDLIFCHLIRSAPYVEKYTHIPKIIDLTDAISLSYKRRIEINRNILDKFKIRVEFKRVLNYEKETIKKFDKIFLVSEFDKNFLSKFIDTNKIKIVPNGIDSEYFYYSQDSYDPNNIVFLGNMRTIANHDAALYFGQKIFPKIKEINKQATFTVIGAYPKQKLFEMAKNIDGIIITGKVDDVRDYLKQGIVSVCPVRIAAGIQNKILESMSMGIPVITMSTGVEGIPMSENEVIIARSDQEITNSILNLMNNPEKRNFYSINARKFIEDNHSWSSVAKLMGNNLEEVLENSKS